MVDSTSKYLEKLNITNIGKKPAVENKLKASGMKKSTVVSNADDDLALELDLEFD